MAHENLAATYAGNTPDRAGEVIITRMVWPITAKSVNDTIAIGTLPPGCRIAPQLCQVTWKNAAANLDAGTFSVTISADGTGTTDQLVDSQAVVAATAGRAAFTTFTLAETLGTSEDNRRIAILVEAGFDLAGGEIVVELAYYSP